MLIDKQTKVIVQGITGNQGRLHTKLMLEFGTNVVAGVNPNKPGGKVQGKPVYATVKEACKKHSPSWSVLFVPAPYLKKAALEALECNLNIYIATEGVPVHDTIELIQEAQKQKLIMVGPNSPGITVPGESKLGIMPNNIFLPGHVSILSRSGTLTHEVALRLTKANIGQRTVIGIGGDRIVGNHFVDYLKMLENDEKTKLIVLIGEIGGDQEEQTAKFIKQSNYKKPIICFIAGRHAPKEKRMGHAGAIVYGSKGTAKSKLGAMKKAGAKTAKTLAEIVSITQTFL